MSKKKMKPSLKAKAEPTKELFISMLIRDISLIDAISDLIDNSVDGALRLNPNKKYKKCQVEISLDDKCFSIKDNCGGISLDMAKDYAFRFGRDPDAPVTDNSIGQFGIGMKRALFKMGNIFEIKSISKKSYFKLTINTESWRKQSDWDFVFDEYEEKKMNIKDVGTEITVSELHKDIKENFKKENFASELREEIRLEHSFNINNGLSIKINNAKLKARFLQLYESSFLKAAHWKNHYSKIAPLDIEIYAGISSANSDEGGWYLFCNDRLIVGHDQTELTGWGEKYPMIIPKYHTQFNRFRGYTFFNSENTIALPWNTSKNSVDKDSNLYKFVRLQMIEMMRIVIDFLNKVHIENGRFQRNQIPEKELQEIINESTLTPFNQVSCADSFTYPEFKLTKTKAPLDVRISYTKPKEQVEMIKKAIKISKPKEIGEYTFDYTFKRECKE